MQLAAPFVKGLQTQYSCIGAAKTLCSLRCLQRRWFSLFNVCSISNRAMLARSIHIEKLMKRNKVKVNIIMLMRMMTTLLQERGSPLQTMIEVVVRYLLEKSGKVSSLSTVQSPHPSTIRYHFIIKSLIYDCTAHFTVEGMWSHKLVTIHLVTLW